MEREGGDSSHHEGAGGSSPPLSGLTASQRRAEIRRRKLLMNSEERINRIMGFHRPKTGEDGAWPGIGGSGPRLEGGGDTAGVPLSSSSQTLSPGSRLVIPRG